MRGSGAALALCALACVALPSTAPRAAAAQTEPAGSLPPNLPPLDEYEQLFGMRMKPPRTTLWNSAARQLAAAARAREWQLTQVRTRCPPIERSDVAQGRAIQRCEAQAYRAAPSYRDLLSRYPVRSHEAFVAGVGTEIFTPADGVTPANRERVLIALHGGSFLYGAGTESRIIAIPIAAVARIEVISVDYRQAPQSTFPDASEDVIRVYREILKKHAPAEVGLYGCGSGALIAAQVTAWLVKQKLPPPGALGLLCEGAGYWEPGKPPMHDADEYIWRVAAENPYFARASSGDPLAFPLRSTALLAGFPQSLLLTTSHDPGFSAVVALQSALRRLGVAAELRVFARGGQGARAGQGYLLDPASADAAEQYAAIARFFEAALGG